ncbi:MAG: nucleotidyltransferase family protein [Nitrospirae bacterium]|nr:nucleotidyltransferase family protein [Nitrospirota bacterium]MBF0535705.1 nucleotidyltransferase family protein [Nitrospirota bacterium]MBF0617530.1 nucleotidyltransferase family protein [Nitrospirota bacterium]
MNKSLDEIKEILNSHREELRGKYKITKIGIFGSYVRGEQKIRSDVDILVEIGEPMGLLRFVHIENLLSDLLQVKVDLVSKEGIRAELKERIINEVVYI